MKNQQQELYAAQREVRPGRRFDSLSDVQKFLDGAREASWWYREVMRVEVGPAAGAKSVGWFELEQHAGRIELASGCRDERTVLHELAHVFADARHSSRCHDPFFCRIFAELVFHVLGFDAWQELVGGYVRHGVVYDERVEDA